MKLVVALGNIGKEYEGTRHNIGFMTADVLADRWKEQSGWRKADNAFYLERRMPEKCFLIKPTTYMNSSGAAVADFANFSILRRKTFWWSRTIWTCRWAPCGFAGKGLPGATMD